MQTYIKELEDLITDVLLPIYQEHYRLLGRPSDIGAINKRLTSAMAKKRQIAYLLQKQNYGR